MLYQLDILKRVAYPPNPSGYYYWTSVYYYDSDDFSNLLAMRTRALTVDRLHSLDAVEYIRITSKQPPGRGNVVSAISAVGNVGLITGWGTEYSLLNVGRLLLYYADGRSSYRFWRAPVAMDWIEGGEFNAFARARMASYINNQGPGAAGREARNQTGAICVGGLSPTRVSGWQMRHGTKRRRRTY